MLKEVCNVNMNDFVKVKLSEKAKLYLIEKHAKRCKRDNYCYSPPKIDNEYYVDQLWKIITDLKELIVFGLEAPFTNITFLGE